MKIGIFGGDKRMLFTAKGFADDGNEVFAAGFDDLLSLCEIKICSVDQAAETCDIAVLPVRPVSEGFLNSPFSGIKVSADRLMRAIGDKPVFSGCAELIKPYTHGKVYDYAAREDFTYRNAGLTAEGAIGIIMNEYEGSVFGSRSLVLGFGRIGKLLSGHLRALGADVTVAARKRSDRALAELCGMKAVCFDDISYGEYDLIFNTVPAPIVDKKAVYSMKEDVFIIDLASAPGGVDFKAADSRGVTCIHALSLPGKCAPLTAGQIIKDTIMNIITENRMDTI